MKFLIPTLISAVSLILTIDCVLAVREMNAKVSKLTTKEDFEDDDDEYLNEDEEF